jgi:predicted TIM-barrel fold metal-dependent hydrolase
VTISLDDFSSNTNFTTNSGRARTGKATFLPEPPRAKRYYPFISVDDHIVEPRWTFEGRVPARFADRAPRIVEEPGGIEVWMYDGNRFPNIGFNALVGRPVSEYSVEPSRFDEMRKGSWDIDARISDMDLNGVYASVNFPSSLPGFAGQRLQLTTEDHELALHTVRAWNDWHIEEWAGKYPDRIIPAQIPWLLDPKLAAEEILRNAERGFKAVSFTESPQKLGLPSLHTDYWDPVMAACEESETVVDIHVGSASTFPTSADDSPPDTIGVLFFGYAMFATVDWLYSKIPVRYPGIKIAISEGGIGWVAGLMDRLDHMLSYHEMYGTWTSDIELTPRETLQRNFWFCAVDDPSSFMQRDRIGVENILLEADYPHCDSTWPLTQEVMRRDLGGLSDPEIQQLAWGNASALYRHPVPLEVQQDPESF